MKKTLSMLLVVILILGCLAGCGKNESASGEVVLAAAASLKNAFEKELIPAFNAKYPDVKITGTYDSSGKLQTQIEEGLAADLFFSASTKQMNALTEKEYINTESRTDLLENKIVLIVPKGGENGFSKFEDIVNAEVVAIGDPESVPAGQYAKEALTTLGIWDTVEAKASLGTNVTEVLNQVAASSAGAGVVYATDAASMADQVTVIASAPDGALAKPVIYPVAMLKNSPNPDAAKLFLDFLKSDEACAVFEKYGFAINK